MQIAWRPNAFDKSFRKEQTMRQGKNIWSHCGTNWVQIIQQSAAAWYTVNSITVAAVQSKQKFKTIRTSHIEYFEPKCVQLTFNPEQLKCICTFGIWYSKINFISNKWNDKLLLLLFVSFIQCSMFDGRLCFC